MFNEDLDYQKLMPVSVDQVSELREEYPFPHLLPFLINYVHQRHHMISSLTPLFPHTYRAKFEVIVKELKHFVLKRSQDKTDEMGMFRQCVTEAKGERDKECIEQLNRYQHEKKQVWFM